MIKLLFDQNKIEEFKNLLKISKNVHLIAKMILLFQKKFQLKQENL